MMFIFSAPRRRASGRNRALMLAGLMVEAGFDRIAPPDGAFYIYADVSEYTSGASALRRTFCNRLGCRWVRPTDSQRAQLTVNSACSLSGCSGSAWNSPMITDSCSVPVLPLRAQRVSSDQTANDSSAAPRPLPLLTICIDLNQHNHRRIPLSVLVRTAHFNHEIHNSNSRAARYFLVSLCSQQDSDQEQLRCYEIVHIHIR